GSTGLEPRGAGLPPVSSGDKSSSASGERFWLQVAWLATRQSSKNVSLLRALGGAPQPPAVGRPRRRSEPRTPLHCWPEVGRLSMKDSDLGLVSLRGFFRRPLLHPEGLLPNQDLLDGLREFSPPLDGFH